MFENKKEPLLSRGKYHVRVIKMILIAFISTFICLGIGVLGYHFDAKFGWLDSFLNASMILGGMGPVDAVHTIAGKWFCSFYALFSGVMFITNIGLVIAPIVHRFLHKLHLDDEE